ncbi:MAG TPA: FMN-binding protein [Gammaproteobacteria bacterium]
MRYPEHWLWLPAIIAPAAISAPAYAVQYLNVEQAQAALYPSATRFDAVPITLTSEQQDAIEEKSGVRVRNLTLNVWKAQANGEFLGWFLVDEVLGKHEFITYAVALDNTGAVRGIEIMDYRETHGGQVRDAEWRAQFNGKRDGDPLKLDEDIQNISGATLSSKHIVDGVKRLLASYEIALK